MHPPRLLVDDIRPEEGFYASVVDSPRRLPVLTKKAAALSQKEPEQVARLIRSWMVEEQS